MAKVRRHIPKLYWHIHHETLSEFSTEPVTNRRWYVKTCKAVHERALRLKLLKPIKLTDELEELFKQLKEINCNYANEYNMWYTSDYKNFTTRISMYSLDDQIGVFMNVMFHQLIEVLHSEQCPNCPWDGYTIFPPEGK